MSDAYRIGFTFEDGKLEDKTVGDKTLKAVDVAVAKDSYTKALADNDIDVKIVKKIEQFNEQYVKSAVKATTEHNTDLFKGKAEMSSTEIPFGISARNNITIDTKKKVTVPFPGKSGEFITGPQIKVAVKTTYTKLSSSYIKGMKDIISESLANG